MGAPAVTRASTLLFTVALAIVGGALYLLALSTGHSAVFSQWHLWLLVANLAVSLLLVVIIGFNLFRLVRALQHGKIGARLTGRLVALFTALAVLPVGAVFYFSVQFINHSIDSWFDIDTVSALQDALTLSRQALASETGPYAGASAQAARMLADRGPEPLQPALARLRTELGAVTLAIFNADGEVIASSAARSQPPKMPPPGAGLAGRLGASGSVARVYTSSGKGLYVQAFSRLPSSTGPPAILEALYPVGANESLLASRVEAAYNHYGELNYLRGPLKLSFTLTLSLVLLLSLLAAVWAAFFAAQRVAAPVQQLVRATRAVARGDFGVKVPEHSRDEVGILAHSFNTMTRGLAEAREEARRGQETLERERAWLATVLGALSSGVVTVNESGRLRIVNSVAAEVLGVEAGEWVGRLLEELLDAHPEFTPLFRPPTPAMAIPYDVQIAIPGGDRTLRAAITDLHVAGAEAPAGRVWIFEDVTEFILAQREAAWGEVARRLAHEIKNPLTPIQLAAERLRMKCLPLLSGREAKILDRSTSTVIAQVKAMQAMVDAFSEYAKSPPLHVAPVDLEEIVREVAELYRGRPGLNLNVEIPANLGPVTADASRLRQILHNLVKNAVEAQEERVGWVRVWIRAAPAVQEPNVLVLRVRDAGPGFSPEVLAHAFEPYVTSKHKGTGLGLALVRKLAEEQGWMVNLANVPAGGAEVTLSIPRGRPALRVLRGGAS